MQGNSLDVDKMIKELRKESHVEEILQYLQSYKEETIARIKELHEQGKRLRQETGKQWALKELEGKGLQTQHDDYLENFAGSIYEIDVIVTELKSLKNKITVTEELIKEIIEETNRNS